MDEHSNFESHISVATREIFKYLIISYCALLAVDFARPGAVSNFLDMNMMLIGLLVFGLASVLFEIRKHYPVKNFLFPKKIYRRRRKFDGIL